MDRITLFVYGTLKPGFGNYRKFCQGCLESWEATLPGRLYDLPYGYPGLVIPPDHILATGTGDPATDVQTQLRTSVPSTGVSVVPEGWDEVHGVVLVLPDPARSLPPIDGLEGFYPGDPSHYHRVLTVATARDGQASIVWTYVLPEIRSDFRYLKTGNWPEGKTG